MRALELFVSFGLGVAFGLAFRLLRVRGRREQQIDIGKLDRRQMWTKAGHY